MKRILAILLAVIMLMSACASAEKTLAISGIDHTVSGDSVSAQTNNLIVRKSANQSSSQLASKTITKIYNQKDYFNFATYWMTSTKKETSKEGFALPSTLASSGCGIFTVAHAIQWLTNDNPEITTVRDHCGNTTDYENGMCNDAMNYLEEDYGISHETQGSSVSEIKTTFDNGGVIIAVTSDCSHYFLGVEYITYNSQTYVHVIDSSTGATLTKGYTGYWIDSMEPIGNYNNICTSGFYGEGHEFWMPMDEFQQKVLLSLTVSV